MTTLLVFVLLVITLVLVIFKYFRASMIMAAVTLIFFCVTGVGVFSSLLAKNLETYAVLAHPVWKKTNAIILLGAGAQREPETTLVKPTLFAYSRIFEAARLYFACKNSHHACTIIISGGDALSIGKSEAEVYGNELTAIGVKPADMILESHSMNTYKNAEFTSAILKTKRFDEIFLVTSGFHMKRAVLFFSYFGVQAIPSVSDYIPAKIYVIPVGYNFAITDFMLHEYGGILKFHVYNYFGWNTNNGLPGAV